MIKYRKSILSLFALLPIAAVAAPSQHMVVAPQCLVQKAALNDNVVSTQNSLALLSVNDDGIVRLIKAKHEKSAKPCGGFIDVTADWKDFPVKNYRPGTKAKTFLSSIAREKVGEEKSYSIKYQSQVEPLMNEVNGDNIWNTLTQLTNFENRHANSTKGVEAATWIATQVQSYSYAYNRPDVEIFKVPTRNYKQPSVVVKIPGKTDVPGVVVGGHMDTLVFFSNRQPGADDDGSGSATIMEAFRTVISSGLTFTKPLYFVWYAAEEEGLIGSGEVVRYFKQKNIPVEAAIQFDMTGYSNSNDPTLWLLSDNTNKNLTSFVADLAKTYVKQPVNYTACGYGCSDHASWHKAGIAAAAPFEAKFGKEDPYIHSVNDTMDVLSKSHMTNFAKLAVAYAVEMAEPVK